MDCWRAGREEKRIRCHTAAVASTDGWRLEVYVSVKDPERMNNASDFATGWSLGFRYCLVTEITCSFFTVLPLKEKF